MYLSIPDYQDPTAAAGDTITAHAWADYVAVGPNDGTGRLVLSPYRDLRAAYDPKARPIGSIDLAPGDGLPSLPELMADPAFAAAWTIVGHVLLTAAAKHHPGASVVLSEPEAAILDGFGQFLARMGG